MRKLFSVLIVGRHPWLFGPLRTKLHLERQWFPSLARSLVAIADRSGNLAFRNKVHALVKAEASSLSISIETEHCPQKIKCQVSVCKEVTGDTCGHLSSRSMSWSCSSDVPAPDTYDTLILALELVLKLAARPPPFKRFRRGDRWRRQTRCSLSTTPFRGCGTYSLGHPADQSVFLGP
ncbi:hypothetical protein BC826DRAFT_667611 [Russula brevipes]|nr:hypothetical protein BC826DRAFT_667611 [Russula brevipes]